MGKIIQYIIIISVLVSCSAIFIKNAEAGNPELKQLYYELMNFKDDAEFHIVGFGVCCRYNKWKLRVEALRDSNKLKTISEKIAAGDLLTLGLEYKNTKGKENDYTRETKGLIVECFE